MKQPSFLFLMLSPVGEKRRKAIITIMKHRGVSFEEAMKIQAKAIERKRK